MEQIYLNIRNRRKELNLTQKELAEKLGYEQSMIAKIETGKVDLSLGKVKEIARALYISPKDLLGEEWFK